MTSFPICLEVGGDGWCMAWVAKCPGAHISRPSEGEAVSTIPLEVGSFLRWLRHFGEKIPVTRALQVEIAERHVFRAKFRFGHTQAFFKLDDRAMTRDEVRTQMRWLRHSRSTLDTLVHGLDPEALTWGTPGIKGRPPGKGGGGWTIGLYLRHIGSVEKWYLQQFWRSLPVLPRSESPFERLAYARKQVEEIIGGAATRDLSRVMTTSGQKWTLRKILRRLLYHERYHMRTIMRIQLHHQWACEKWLLEALGAPELLSHPRTAMSTQGAINSALASASRAMMESSRRLRMP